LILIREIRDIPGRLKNFSFSENFASQFLENICGEDWVTMLDATFWILDEEMGMGNRDQRPRLQGEHPSRI